MWRRWVAIAVALAMAFLPLCCSSTSHDAPPDADMQLARKGEHAFALNLYAKLRKPGENLFFSPFSISTALAMTYAGARGNTAAQMATVCGFDLPPERLHPVFAALLADLNSAARQQAYELVVANALWGRKGVAFDKGYLDLVRKRYGGGLQQVDFSQSEDARQAINRWVEEQTRNRIKDLIAPGILGEMTGLVLTNTIYFKGKWQNPFWEHATREEPFFLLSGTKVSVPMMHRPDDWRYAEGDDFQVIELPYKSGSASMVIFLPKKPDGLPTFEEAITRDRLAQSLAELSPQEVIVSLPRFTITCGSRLDDALKALGMPDAFDPKAADFSGMRVEGGIWVNAILHKAFVDVTEEGTEAAAASAIAVEKSVEKVGPEPPKVFKADHPFLFLIRDTKSGTILFMGRVMNPREP